MRAPTERGGYSSKPPVIFAISDCASALPCAIPCFTPLNTTSSRNSTSFGSTISLSILIEITSPAPFATTFTFPPTALTSTVFSSSLACVWAICSCIFCACFINLLRFIIFGSGFYFTFENLERFLDERIVFKFFGLARRLRARALARQSFFRAQFCGPIAASDFLEQGFKLTAIGGGGERLNGRFFIGRIAKKEIATLRAQYSQRINQRAQKSFRGNLRTDLFPDFRWLDGRIRFRGDVWRRLLAHAHRFRFLVAAVGDRDRSGVSDAGSSSFRRKIFPIT